MRARTMVPTVLLCAAVSVVGAACGSSAKPASQSSGLSAPASATTSSTAPSTRASTSPAPHAVQHTVSAAARRKAAEAHIESIIKAAPKGGVSVAARNISTGASYSAGARGGMWTASAYKLFLLESLMVQNQRDGESAAGGSAGNATRAIENSDNVAGWSLYEAVGMRSGYGDQLGTLGLHHTTPGYTDPTFTKTSAPDCITLLDNLVSKSSPLHQPARSYALNLMRNVEPDQRWGVGVASDKGTDFANKNGWLGIDNGNGADGGDNGRWVVTSVGVLTVHKQTVLMAVLTQHNPDMGDGVQRIQNIARSLRTVVG